MKKRTKEIAVLCLCAVLSTGVLGCQKNMKTHSEISAAADRKNENKIESLEDANSNLGIWARAMGSVLIELNDGNPYVFGGYAANDANKESASYILSTSWDIKNREELLKQISLLITEGHRKSYRSEAKAMAGMKKSQLKKSFRQLEGDTRVYYEMIYDNWKTWKKKGLLAWDMCRVSHLAQWGYIADYITIEEAQALIEPAAKRLKENFSSWEEVQNNWLDGYCVFACVDKTQENTDYTNRKALYGQLKEEQSENGLLYDDSLFEKEIVPIEGISYKTLFDEVS